MVVNVCTAWSEFKATYTANDIAAVQLCFANHAHPSVPVPADRNSYRETRDSDGSNADSRQGSFDKGSVKTAEDDFLSKLQELTSEMLSLPLGSLGDTGNPGPSFAQLHKAMMELSFSAHSLFASSAGNM